MSEPSDYLIPTEPGDLHDLRIAWAHNRSMLYISTNSRTIGLSPAMAESLSRGLLACLRGGFSRAISETSLLHEQQEASRRLARIPAPAPAPSSNPELDQL